MRWLVGVEGVVDIDQNALDPIEVYFGKDHFTHIWRANVFFKFPHSLGVVNYYIV